jgi:hypothetical protein
MRSQGTLGRGSVDGTGPVPMPSRDMALLKSLKSTDGLGFDREPRNSPQLRLLTAAIGPLPP